VWSHTMRPGVNVTLAGGDGDDAKPYQERAVSQAIRASQDEDSAGI